MYGKLRRVLTLPLILTFLLGGFMLVRMLWERQAADTAYQEAEELAGLPEIPAIPPAEISNIPPAVPEKPRPAAAQESTADSLQHPETPSIADTAEEPADAAPPSAYADPYAGALEQMDFTALREVNEDVLGWILIPGVLSYPLMAGEDNDFYLNHTWKGTYSSVGAIFLDSRNSSGLDEFNAIIYGHRMKNDSMFGRLDEYAAQSFRDRHPHIYLTSDAGTQVYEIFAAYEAVLPSTAYQITFHGGTERQAFLNTCLERSVIESAIPPTVDSRILTLSTCAGSGHDSRWVVHAVLQRPDGG